MTSARNMRSFLSRSNISRGVLRVSVAVAVAVAAIAAALLSTLAGCEVVTDSKGLPYVDHIVVKGTLTAGDSVNEIYLSHTTPLSEPFALENSWIPDASATISDGDRSWPLVYVDSGRFAAPGLLAESGKTYRLDVTWNGLHATSHTFIPAAPSIDSLLIETVQYSSGDVMHPLLVGTKPTPSVVYLVETDQSAVDRPGDTLWHSINYGYRPTLPEEIDSATGLVLVPTEVSINPQGNGNTVRVSLYAFDRAYYDFFTTDNAVSDDIFGSIVPTAWNVEGDGIGIFIGASKTSTLLK